jgi:hypothetical protein
MRGTKGHVRAREDRQPDGVGVLLDHGLHDLLGGLMQAGVDDLHAGIAQRPRDDLRAAIVPVQAGLGDDDADALGVRGWGEQGGRNALPSTHVGPRVPRGVLPRCFSGKHQKTGVSA